VYYALIILLNLCCDKNKLYTWTWNFYAGLSWGGILSACTVRSLIRHC